MMLVNLSQSVEVSRLNIDETCRETDRGELEHSFARIAWQVSCKILKNSQLFA
jgi:hypothetical protein